MSKKSLISIHQQTPYYKNLYTGSSSVFLLSEGKSNPNKFERLKEGGSDLQEFERSDEGQSNLNKVENNIVCGF